MEDTPATRQATKARIGPWYVLQNRNPAAPGMKYATLLALIHRGHVTPRSVVRGPTTYQLWRFAAHVRGVSREFGLCYSCGGTIDRGVAICPHCQRAQDPPSDPDVLLEPRGSASATAQVSAPQPGPIAIQEIPTSEPPRHMTRLRDFNLQLSRREKAQQEQAANSDSKQSMPAIASGGARTDGHIVSAMNLAAAFQQDESHGSGHGPGRRSLKVLFALVLLAAAGTAAALYARPDWRVQTLEWMNQGWGFVQIKWNDWTRPRAAAPVHDESTPAPTPVVVTTEPAAAPAPPLPAPAAPATAATQQPPTAAAATEVEPPAPTPRSLSAAEAIDQARQLWRAAIDAEARRDFTGATRLYEQIKQLPSDAWPAGLQLRLEMAQKRAGQTKAD
jgi:hypothetical protein